MWWNHWYESLTVSEWWMLQKYLRKILVEPLVETDDRLEWWDLGMAVGYAVQYPPVFLWCEVVESKRKEYLRFISFMTLL